MARPRPRPRAQPPPHPRPDPPPHVTAQGVADRFGIQTLRTLNGLTDLMADAGTGGDFTTECVNFVFSGAAMLTYRCNYNGWVAGWKHALNTGLGISINTDLPTSPVSVQGIYYGYLLAPQNLQFTNADDVQPNMRAKFKVNDIINVRNIVAGANHVLVFLCRFT